MNERAEYFFRIKMNKCGLFLASAVQDRLNQLEIPYYVYDNGEWCEYLNYTGFVNNGEICETDLKAIMSNLKNRKLILPFNESEHGSLVVHFSKEIIEYASQRIKNFEEVERFNKRFGCDQKGNTLGRLHFLHSELENLF